MSRAFLLAASLFVTSSGVAQNAAPELALKEFVEVPSEPNGAVSLPASCSSDGDLYVRPYSIGSNIPLLKISRKGQPTIFAVDPLSNLVTSFSLGFGISPGGKLYELMTDNKGVRYLASFSEDGTLESKTRLETDFESALITPLLGDRTFLISGIQKQQDKSRKNLTAFFDTSGRLVKELDLPGDVKTMSAPITPNSKPTSKLPLPDVLLQGSVLTGADGRIYILRHTEPATIYILNSTGELEHSIKLNPPETGMIATDLSASSGRLAVYFRKYDVKDGVTKDEVKSLIVVVDSSTGNVISTHGVPREAGMAFACYTIDRFGFLGDKNGHFAVVWLGP